MSTQWNLKRKKILRKIPGLYERIEKVLKHEGEYTS